MLSKKKFEEIKAKFPIGTIFYCLLGKDRNEEDKCEITEELDYDNYLEADNVDIIIENEYENSCYIYDNCTPKKLAKIIKKGKSNNVIQIY